MYACTHAGKNDIVLAPPVSQEFQHHLTHTLGFKDLPLFVETMEEAENSGRTISGVRPFGVPGKCTFTIHIDSVCFFLIVSCLFLYVYFSISISLFLFLHVVCR